MGTRMPIKFLIGLSFAVVLLATDSIATSAAAGTCRKNTREIALGRGNVLQLKDYVCRNDRDPRTQVRVQFQRLSGLAAGALLYSGRAPWTSALYGKHRIVSNGVLGEYRNLIRQFGSAVRAKDHGSGDQIRVRLFGQYT
jgi:hypothetical protein